jgi:hypothetical protein
MEELDDASNELMLSDEDSVRFVVGECLVHFEKDTAESRLEQVRLSLCSATVPHDELAHSSKA